MNMGLGDTILEEVDGFRPVEYFFVRKMQMSNVLQDLNNIGGTAQLGMLKTDDSVFTFLNNLRKMLGPELLQFQRIYYLVNFLSDCVQRFNTRYINRCYASGIVTKPNFDVIN